MKRHNKKAIQSAGSDSEKMAENPTLVRKGIRTYYGIVEDSLETKRKTMTKSVMLKTDV